MVHSLPIFTYASIQRRSTSSPGDCAVCLSKFEPQNQLRLLPLCCHAFHVTCIDTWLESNQTCPLCRSPIHASESDLLKAISSAGDNDSLRLEIGSIGRRLTVSDSGFEPRSSYSLGSFEYLVDEESDMTMNRSHRRSFSDKEIGNQESQNLASEVGGGRSWLREYVDRVSASISSRELSFRSSGRIFTGSSRRTEIGSIGDYEVESNRIGEEISEMFRWFSGEQMQSMDRTSEKVAFGAGAATGALGIAAGFAFGGKMVFDWVIDRCDELETRTIERVMRKMDMNRMNGCKGVSQSHISRW